MSDDQRVEDSGEGKRFFRSSDRVFRQGDGWYYSAREGDRGPYDTEAEAREQLTRFIQEQKDLKSVQASKEMQQEVESRRVKTKPAKDVWQGLPDVD